LEDQANSREASGNRGKRPATDTDCSFNRIQEHSMNKIAIVTGASRGLGRNTALHIARGGGDVILTYQSRADDAQAVVAEIRAHGPQGARAPARRRRYGGLPLFVEQLRAALRDTWKPRARSTTSSTMPAMATWR
jgi:NAD(P)-dependent dehydrogenase (short-subunit alcohol dehydrogenase family)